jgi:hypothetical protein
MMVRVGMIGSCQGILDHSPLTTNPPPGGSATVKESLTVQKEGQRTVQRRVEIYNLDVIISVGYRREAI